MLDKLNLSSRIVSQPWTLVRELNPAEDGNYFRFGEWRAKSLQFAVCQYNCTHARHLRVIRKGARTRGVKQSRNRNDNSPIKLTPIIISESCAKK